MQKGKGLYYIKEAADHGGFQAGKEVEQKKGPKSLTPQKKVKEKEPNHEPQLANLRPPWNR